MNDAANSRDHLSQLLKQFADEWRAGKPPSLQSYLHQVPEEDHSTMLRRLLEVDIQQRSHAHLPVDVEMYVQQIPVAEDDVRSVFSDTVSSLDSVGTAQSEGPETAIFLNAPTADMIGDYRIIRRLGGGAQGQVFEAEHEQRKNRVALKLLPEFQGLDAYKAGQRLILFKEEFRKLSDIVHPNLVVLHSLEQHGEQWFITMELIHGMGLPAYVRPHGSVDNNRLRHAFLQLATAVSFLESIDKVHQDLKPPNVMVTMDHRVVVLDFGLVINAQSGQSIVNQDEQFAGTIAYAAPEQGQGRPDSRADWYALGTMMYELMVGRLPFLGEGLKVLLRKAAEKAEPIRDHTLPADLVEITMGLLETNPGDRDPAIEKAKALLAAPSSAPAVTRVTLVGRDGQFAQLRAALEHVDQTSNPTAVFVSGLSGEGKSELIDQFLEPLRFREDCVVLSGRCYDRESMPFKALDSLIDALCSHLQRNLSREQASTLIPDDIGFLAELFPVMKTVHVIDARLKIEEMPGMEVLGIEQVRHRAFGALRLLLTRIARGSRLVLFVDDLQWGDSDSAAALFEVLRSPQAPKLLFVGSYRRDEAKESSFLTEWSAKQRDPETQVREDSIVVGPLKLDDCMALIQNHMDVPSFDPRQLAQGLLDQTGGNPYLIEELLATVDPQQGTLQSAQIHELIDRKLARLPAECQKLLSIIAVSQHAVTIDDASAGAGFELAAIDDIDRMRAAKLVRLIGREEDQLVDTYHDKIRETVIRQLDEQTQREMHCQIARLAEQRASIDFDSLQSALAEGRETSLAAEALHEIYDLSFHYDAAGERERARVYSLLSAEQARSQYALDVAVEHYTIAKRNTDSGDKESLFRIAHGCGETLIFQGRYETAKAELEGAIDLVEDPVSKARIDALYVEVATKQADPQTAIMHCERGLKRLGVKVPKSLFGYGMGLARESVIQAWHTMLPSRLHKRQPDERLYLINQLFNRIIPIYAFTNMMKMMWALLMAMNRAERIPRSSELAFTYALHSGTIALLGWHSRAKKYGDLALSLREEMNDEWGLGHCYGWRGTGKFLNGAYYAAIEDLTKAIEYFERTGDPWEENFARFHLACCHYRLGDLQNAVRDVLKTFESSQRLGDSRTHCSLLTWSRAVDGNLDFEALQAQFKLAEDEVMPTVNLMIGKGVCQLKAGQHEASIETLESAWKKSLRSVMVNFHTIASLTWLVTALRSHSEHLSETDSASSRKQGRRALKLAKLAAWITRFLFPGDYPHALRELALLQAQRGRLRKAATLLNKSCRVAEKQAAAYELAQSSLERAKLAIQLNEAAATDQLTAAEQKLAEFTSAISVMTDG